MPQNAPKCLRVGVSVGVNLSAAKPDTDSDDPMIDDLRRFIADQRILTPAGMEAVERKLADWVRRLRARGVTQIPSYLATWSRDEAEAAVEVMALFAPWLQALQKPLKIPRAAERLLGEYAHQFRNLSGVRVPRPRKRKRPGPNPEPSERRA